MKILQFRSFITILFVAIMLSGCNILSDTIHGATDLIFGEEEPRGGVGTVYLGRDDTDDEVNNAIATRTTGQKQETLIAKDDNDIFYNSLTEAANDEYVGNDGPDGLNERIFILQGLSVQREGTVQVTASGELGWNQASSTENDIVRITAPSVSLTFSETGQISAVTAYFADKEYSATNITADGTAIKGTIESVGGNYNISGNNRAEITLNRSDSFFGFNSNYMAHIGWDVVQQEAGSSDAYNVTGSMIVGIETASIPINNIYYASPGTVSNSIKFTGKGHGVYGDLNGVYATKFDFNADIDFASNLITLGSTNTIRCPSGSSLNCGNGSDASQLNFTTSLGAIPYNGNNIFGVVGAEELLGFVDARFYGVSAREFGGTIILKGRGVEYYYGAFGAQRAGIIRNAAFNNAISSATPNATVTVVTDDNVAFFGAMDESFTGLKTLSAYRDNRNIYSRPPTRAWEDNTDRQNVVTVAKTNRYSTALLFDGDGMLSEVTLNLADGNTDISGLNQNYTVAGQVNADGIFTSTDTTENISVTVDRKNVFGLADGNASNYMAYISWDITGDASFDPSPENKQLIDNSYSINGNMIAGIETFDLDFTTYDESVEFTGKGRGTYGNLTSSYDTIFDVSIDVDFKERQVTRFETNGTECKIAGCVDPKLFDLSQLDFTATGALTYIDNAISGAVETYKSSKNLTGTIDARFYGSGAWEFGGTFALADKSNYYYGVFGAERLGFETSSPLNTVELDSPIIIAAPISASTSYASITDLVDSGDGSEFVMNSLSVYTSDITTYQRAPNRSWLASDGIVAEADTNKEVSIAMLTGSSASIGFDSSKNIKSVTAYLDGNNYTAIIDTPVSGTKVVDATIALRNGELRAHEDNADFSPSIATISVDRSSDFFGFDTEYMMHISWHIAKEADSLNADSTVLSDDINDNLGIMLAGIEVAGNDIPKGGLSIDFVGKGKGRYVDGNDKVYQTVFDAKANVNFLARRVLFSTENSCATFQTDGEASACNEGVEIDLDIIQTTLEYQSRKNNISGTTVTTTDLLMAGRADARFYGDKSREFGGTFSLTNDNSYYYGAFGGFRITGIVTAFTFIDDIVDIDVDPQQATLIAKKSDTITPYNSLAEAANDASHAANKEFTLPALSVYINSSSVRTRVAGQSWSTADGSQAASLNRVNGSAASITFNDNGYISGASVYLKDETYTASIDSPASSSNFSATITTDVADSTSATLNIDRSADFFGVGNGLNYVAYISWDIEKEENELSNLTLESSEYNIDGAMIAGMEVAATDMAAFTTAVGSNIVTFRGAGRGYYGEQQSDNNVRTIFDVEATVKFNNKTVTLESADTYLCYSASDDACVQTTSLNFVALNLGFKNQDETINNTISGNMNAGTLTGKVDARFYGDSNVQELAGTFALKNDDDYYYGAFGAHRDHVAAIGAPIYYDTTVANIDIPVADRESRGESIAGTPYSLLTAFNESKSGNQAKTRGYVLEGISVSKQDATHYYRTADQLWSDAYREKEVTLSQITGSFGRINFYSEYITKFTAIFGDGKEYNSETNGGSATASGNISTSGGYNGTLSVTRDAADFGFFTEFMFALDWNVDTPNGNLDNGSDRLAETRTNDIGFMVAGMETNGENIYTSTYKDDYRFTGKGRGVYSNDSQNTSVKFDVTADVNFNTRNITLASTNTACVAESCTGVPLSESRMDFSGTLNYDVDSNVITGGVVSTLFTGEADARFYGDYQGNSFREFGGTFAMTHNSQATEYYYGYFGGNRGAINDSPLDDADIIPISNHTITATPEVFVQNGGGDAYQSINAIRVAPNTADPKISTWNALATYRNDDDLYSRKSTGNAWDAGDILKEVELATVTNASLSFTFDTDADISAVQLIFGDGSDERYSKVDSTPRDLGRSFSTSNSTSHLTEKVDVSRDSNVFGGIANYMMYANWSNESNDPDSGYSDTTYDYFGHMIAGFETEDSTFPARGPARVFTGKGAGHYNDLNGGKYKITFDTKLDVDFTAADFANQGVKLTVTGSDCTPTCNNPSFTNSLNFTDLPLIYTAGISPETTGTLSANLTIATNSAGALKGTVDGRFYGAGAWEAGGIFALKSDNNAKYYHGYFGGIRDEIADLAFDDTTDKAANPANSESIPLVGGNAYESLYHARLDNSAKTFKLEGVATYRDRKSYYSEHVDGADGEVEHLVDFYNITNPALSLTFDTNKKISGATLHLDNTYNYAGTPSTSGSSVFVSDIDVSSGFSDATTARVTISRDGDFNFESNYMAYVRWSANKTRVDSSNGLYGEEYDVDGYMIAGMEATIADVTAFKGKFTTDSATFNGRGRYEYYRYRDGGTSNVSSAFTTAMTINFSTNVVDFSTSNVGASYLNINSSSVGYNALTYDATNNTISGTTGRGNLVGAVNIRLYGDDGLWESGGVITLNDGTAYYQGYFGAERNSITDIATSTNSFNVIGSGTQQTVSTPAAYDSIAEALDDTNNTAAFTLKGLSITRDASKDYSRAINRDWNSADIKNRSVALAKIVGSALSVSFDSAGDVTSATSYLNDGANFTYTANSFTNSNSVATANINNLDSDYSAATTNTLTIDRSEETFGFVPEYMLYASWSVAKNTLSSDDSIRNDNQYDIDGFTIAGMDVVGADVPISGITKFEGKGRGIYGDIDNEYATIFDVKLDFDFSDKSNVGFNITNTACVVSGCSAPLATLNIGATLAITANTNDITGTGTITNAVGDLSGAIDARFYGDEYASKTHIREVGGTFSLKNSGTNYYMGAFGSERLAITSFTLSTLTDTQIAATEQLTPMGNAESFQKMFSDESNNQFTFNALSVSRNITTSYARLPEVEWNDADITQVIGLTTTSGANAEIQFGTKKKIGNIKLHYLPGNSNADYAILQIDALIDDAYRNDAHTLTHNIGFGAPADADTATLTADRRADLFGFIPNYMVNVSWNILSDTKDTNNFDVTSSNYDNTRVTEDGMMIAGFELGGSYIPTSGSAIFHGKGQGVYGKSNETQSYATLYNLEATADFTNTSLALAITDTVCTGDINATTCNALNFTSTLTYAENTNNISGTASAGSLTGTAQARFYGKDKIAELGGTFSLQDSNSYYYGSFGSNNIRHDINGTQFGVYARELNAQSSDVVNGVFHTTSKPNSYTSFNKVVVDGGSHYKYIRLNALSVSADSNIFYERDAGDAWADNKTGSTVSLTKNTNANAAIGFGGHENIFYVAAFLKYGNYKTDALAGNDRGGKTTLLNADITSGAPNNSISAKISANRAVELFGFTPHYMTNITWDITNDSVNTNNLDSDSAYLINMRTQTYGYMMAGFEVAGGNIPTSDKIYFFGQGRGTYGDKTAAATYNTQFNIKTIADFSTRNVALTSSDTYCISDAAVCAGLDATTLASLNFTSTLTYAAGINNITGTLTTAGYIDSNDATNNIATLTGTADARFYGNERTTDGNSTAVEILEATETGYDLMEFGGTFSMQDSDYYYYGALGGKETEYFTFDDTETPYQTWATSGTSTTFNGFSHYNGSTTPNPLIQTFAITQSGSKITDIKINTLNPDGTIAETDNFNTDITNNYIYDGNGGAANHDGNTGSIRIITTADDSDKFIAVVHQPDRAPWNWNYQTVGFIDNGENERGGFSTGSLSNDLPTEGIASFTGRAYGYYTYPTGPNYITRADTNIDVNFGAGTAEIATSNTRRVVYSTSSSNPFSSFEGSNDSAPAAFADFTGTLNYDSINKWYKGGLITSGANNVTPFKGDATIKVYGPNAEEVGGIFRFVNSNRTYVGGFGAIPTFYKFADSATEYKTWANIGNSATLNGLSYYANGDNPLTQTFNITQTSGKITDVKINTLNGNGTITATRDFNTTTFLGTDYYHVHDGGGDVSASDSNSGSLRIISRDNDNNSYVVVAHEADKSPWNWDYQTVGILYKNNSLGGSGGFSTGSFTNDVPTSGSASFTGRAYGFYRSGTSEYLTRANATIVTNFSAGTATIATTDTRKTVVGANIGNGYGFGDSGFHSFSSDETILNFTGTLSYNAYHKEFKGVVTGGTNAGSGEAVLKAYGPNAEEVGGVFKLEGNNRYYAGGFGAVESFATWASTGSIIIYI